MTREEFKSQKAIEIGDLLLNIAQFRVKLADPLCYNELELSLAIRMMYAQIEIILQTPSPL